MSMIIGGPNAGNGAAPAAGDLIKDSNTQNFMKDVIEPSRTTPVIVDFWAPWCGPCKVMAPHFERAARELEPGVRLAKVNTEDEQAVAAKYDIRSIPTLIAFRGGREVARQSGAMDASALARWVRSAVG